MREIKFRAWVDTKDSYHKGMYYGVEKSYDTLGEMTNTKGEEVEYYWQSFDSVLCEAKDGELILMQYTGLKDKNGKEIYEGDLIRDSDGIAEVKWAQSECGFIAWYNQFNILNFPKDCEVIGNVWENKDLLK